MQAGGNGSADISDDGTTLLGRLRSEIVSGRFPPGVLLSELTLAEAFSVSRTPVREALKQLQVEGLVVIRPRVGTFVREPSRRELVELFEIKQVLEGLAARLIAARGRIPEVDQLESNVSASEAAVAAGDAERYAELVHDFHQLLIDGADNSRLSAHYRTLMNQLAYHRLVITSLKHAGRLGASLHEHKLVLSRVLEKDGHGAELAMRDHVMCSQREVMSDASLADGDQLQVTGANGEPQPV